MSEQFKSGFVALLGRTNAGKSTLLNTLLRQKVAIVSPKPQTTRNQIVGVQNLGGAQIAYIDTPGILSRNVPASELSRYLKNQAEEGVSQVDLRVLVVDAPELDRHPESIAELASMLEPLSIKELDIIALNKIDKMDKQRLLPLMSSMDKQPFMSKNTVLVPISAMTGDGVSFLESEIVLRLPQGEALFPTDQYTAQTERFFVAEIVRERLFYHLEQELPYSIAVQVESWNEKDELLSCDVVIHVERESQKGIVIGKGGELLKKVGSEARQQLEKLLGIHVFLKLFVRVEPNWTQSVRGLNVTGVITS